MKNSEKSNSAETFEDVEAPINQPIPHPTILSYIVRTILTILFTILLRYLTGHILHVKGFLRFIVDYVMFTIFEKFVLCYPFFGFTYKQLNRERKDVEYIEAVRLNGRFLMNVFVYDIAIMFITCKVIAILHK